MANYRKSFNFRSGVQVDNDRFIVDPRGNVGIGTSITNRPLDVYGSARVNGNLETETLKVSSASTFTSLVSIGQSIFANPSTGIISAVSYRGDGTLLAGVIAIATNGWVVANGTLSTSFNAYVGPFPENNYPQALGPLQVGTGSSVVLVSNNGLFGIGTTQPITKLDVRGPAIISGVTTFSNGLVIDKPYSLYFGLTGSGNPNGLQIRHTNSLGAEIANVSNLGGDDRKITIQSSYNGDIVLKGSLSDRASFASTATTIHNTLRTPGFIATGIATFGSTTGNSGVVDVLSSTGGRTYITPGSISFNGTLSTIQAAGTQLFFRSGGSGTASYYFSNYYGGFDHELFTIDTNGSIRATGNASISGVSTFVGTGTFDSNVLVGNNIKLANGIVTATTFVGNLSGIASVATSLADGANIVTGTISDDRLPSLITSNISTVSGISTINKIRVETIGIGTDNFTSDIALVKDSSVKLEVISKQGTATISVGKSETSGNNSASIKYNTVSEALDVVSYGSGDVTFQVHKGTGDVVGTQTGGFLFKTGSVDRVLMNIDSKGRVSVNEQLSPVSDLGYSLIVNGNTKIRGALNLDQGITSPGIITALSLRLTENSTFPTTQNFNIQSGITTFYKLNVSNQFTSVGFSSFVGVTTFLGGFETKASSQFNSPTTHKGTILGLSTSNFFYDFIGGITTGFNDPRDQSVLVPLSLDPSHTILPFAGYGDMQLRTGGINIITQDYIAIQPSLTQVVNSNWPGLTPAENIGMGLEFINWNLCKVGINTLYIRSIFDVGYGNSSNSSYFIPPRLSTNEVYAVSQLWNPAVASSWQGHARAKLATPDGLVTGGIVFDHEKNQLKVATGSTTFCGVATFTNNHSGYEAFVPPKVTSAQRTTLTNGGLPEGSVVYNTDTDTLQQYDGSSWSSLVKQTGIGTQATISVIGTKIFFTVAGIGSTSLTLV